MIRYRFSNPEKIRKELDFSAEQHGTDSPFFEVLHTKTKTFSLLITLN